MSTWNTSRQWHGGPLGEGGLQERMILVSGERCIFKGPVALIADNYPHDRE